MRAGTSSTGSTFARSGRRDLLEGIAPSEPPCRRVEMVGAAPAEVLGMLPDKLPCTLWTPAGAGARRKLCLDLAGVLVVESLPVPLHVSLKSLMESCGDDETLASHLCVAAQGDPVENRFGRAAFPERYRDHDFWLDRDPKTDPKSNLPREQVIRAESALMAARGRDGVSCSVVRHRQLMGSEEDGRVPQAVRGVRRDALLQQAVPARALGDTRRRASNRAGLGAWMSSGAGGDEPWRADDARSLEGSVRAWVLPSPGRTWGCSRRTCRIPRRGDPSTGTRISPTRTGFAHLWNLQTAAPSGRKK